MKLVKKSLSEEREEDEEHDEEKNVFLTLEIGFARKFTLDVGWGGG